METSATLTGTLILPKLSTKFTGHSKPVFFGSLQSGGYTQCYEWEAGFQRTVTAKTRRSNPSATFVFIDTPEVAYADVAAFNREFWVRQGRAIYEAECAVQGLTPDFDALIAPQAVDNTEGVTTC
jgi:hypothetical protein